jgi:hypothetical protein
MPYEYTIDAERRLIITRWWGDLTDQDMFDHHQQLGMDPRFNPEFSVLLDMSDATDYTGLTVAGLKKAAQKPFYGPHTRRAVIAPREALFGLARLFDAYREIARGEEHSRVFTNRPAAMLWLIASDSEL